MLEQWDKFSPKEQCLTSCQKAILYSSHRPDQGLLPVWKPSSVPLPSPPFGPGPSAAWGGVYSVLSSSLVSSVGCWRLGTWCLGLPLVHHPPSWSQWLRTARHPLGAAWKACGRPPAPTRPEHRNSGGTRVLSPLSPTPTAPHPCSKFKKAIALNGLHSSYREWLL